MSTDRELAGEPQSDATDRAQQEQQPDGPDIFVPLGLDIAARIFDYCSPHERICRISQVSKFFRRTVRERVFPAILEQMELQGLEQVPMYAGKTVNMVNVYHAGRHCLPKYTSDIAQSEWSTAAFLGEYDHLVKLLGDDIMTTKDQHKRSVLHFAAWGGQNKLIKTLLEKHDQKCLDEEQKAENSVMFYAVIGKHLHTVIMLARDFKIDLFSSVCMGLKFYGELKSWNLSDENLLALSEVLFLDQEDLTNAQAWLSETQDHSLTSLRERLQESVTIPAELLNEVDDIPDANQLEELIVKTMKELINNLSVKYIGFLTHLVLLQRHQLALQHTQTLAM